jgi:hypothetical protein
MGITQDDFVREIAPMIGELRGVTMDVGSFLACSTEGTNEQRLALAHLVHRYRPSVRSVYVTRGGQGLNLDWLLVDLRHEAGTFLTAGIDPEGRVSS